MKATIARKQFKEKFGQANHFLITTLVGLDAIERKTITEKGAAFSTSWNPKDQVASAKRSRVFVLRSFLGSAVEALEMYLTQLNRKPKLLQDHENDTFLRIYSSAGQSIYKKVIGVGDEIKVDAILIGLMEVMVTWRNYALHYDIDNEIRETSWNSLIAGKKEIAEKFNGLDIERLRLTWEKGKDFTFKEIASLIKATQEFVSHIDAYIIKNLDVAKYVLDTLDDYFKDRQYVHRFRSSREKTEYLRSVIETKTGLNDIDFVDQSFVDLIMEKYPN